MTKMFNEGYRLAVEGKLWRKDPPGVYEEERPFSRSDTKLQRIPLRRTGSTVDTSLPPLIDPNRFIVPNMPVK
jgi:hypothetical protein